MTDLLQREDARSRAGGTSADGAAVVLRPVPPPRRTWWHVPAGWLRRHAVSLVLLLLVLVPVAIVQSTNMENFPVRHDDEGTYAAQAWVFAQDFRLAQRTYWYDHPPLGWMQLAAYDTVTRAGERAQHAVAAGREAMVVVHLIASALLYLLCRRLAMARGWALAAVALFSLSPLAITYHRMVFLDNIAIPWLLAAFVLALTPNKRLAAHAGSAACFAMAVLTKETMLLALPALVYQVWQNTDRANRRYTWTVFFSVLVMVGALYPLYALLRGELLPGPDHVSLWDAVVFHLADRGAEDPSAVRAFWLSQDHLLPLFGVLALVPAVLQHRLRPVVAMAAVFGVMAFRPGYLPDPFVIVLLPVAAVLVAGALDGVWRERLAGTPNLAWAPKVLAAVLAGAIAVTVVPAWSPGVHAAMRHDYDATLRQATAWIAEHASTDDRLLMENLLWVDLVRAGHPEENLVWFYQLALDPEVQEELPGGYRDLDYIVATPVMYRTARGAGLDEVLVAFENSETVIVFEGGGDRVEIRRVVHEREDQ